MCDIKVKSIIPDGEYRAMMVRLSLQLSSDLDAVKYMLRNIIRDGESERLDNILDVFVHLEQREFVGPGNLHGLQELLHRLERHELCAMVASFIETMETGE